MKTPETGLEPTFDHARPEAASTRMRQQYDSGREAIQQVQDDVRQHGRWVDPVRAELGRVIVGQQGLIDSLLIGLLADGHLLLEGVPGLAKTLALKSLAGTIDSSFRRVQFTPDLLPADIIGTEIYRLHDGSFETKVGPVFGNLVLADEINRAPAKVQSALLEAMQERQITIGENTLRLPEPFLVMATQNPIEQEGTYPLPEAQLDRFLLKVLVDYPSDAEEREILELADRSSGHPMPSVERVVHGDDVLAARRVVERIYVDGRIKDYMVRLVAATRRPGEFGLGLTPYIRHGGSPRATLGLQAAGKAHAFLDGRGFVTPEDVKAVAFEVLRHRVLTTFEAQAEGLTSDDLVGKVLEAVRVP